MISSSPPPLAGSQETLTPAINTSLPPSGRTRTHAPRVSATVRAAQQSAMAMTPHVPQGPSPLRLSQSRLSSRSLSTMGQRHSIPEPSMTPSVPSAPSTEQNPLSMSDSLLFHFPEVTRYPLINIKYGTPSQKIESSEEITSMLMQIIDRKVTDASYVISEFTFFTHQFILATRLHKENPALHLIFDRLTPEQKNFMRKINNPTA